jgi:hypothetical protein
MLEIIRISEGLQILNFVPLDKFIKYFGRFNHFL